MFNLPIFSKNKARSDYDIDLISIHIPKTGGTSFYQTLESAYPSSMSINYKRQHIDRAKKWGKINFSKLPSFSENIRVIHGHFSFSEVASLYRPSQTKVLTWLRDPIDRVVSDYRFFMKNLKNPHLSDVPNFLETHYPEIKHRENETLLEYAFAKNNRNVIHKFLKGIPLEDLFFIGFLETFEEDIQTLKKHLHWTELEIPYLNKSSSTVIPKLSLDTSALAMLKNWNYLDVALYEKALALRNK